ncbi:MAG: LLM class flavin-dependent oxidoreductase [Theionarchaea archaeon]|nr:LLM class flavin-dependent oxidoreductase [Theionarchaea archaeon]MBU7036775.1 LLM class flavin-dependent oxidoreductase [Theionarchaea archaeon]
MQYGIEVVPFGQFGDPKVMIEFAHTAEEAGWEGIWVWDHILFPYGVGDPWVILSAVAASTEELKIITGVSPLPRYHVTVLARLLTSLDILSRGRVVFGAGLGIDHEFAQIGGPGDPRVRGAMLDEGLELLINLWSGTPVTHEGTYYTLRDVTAVPTPIQPQIPIWVGGESNAALRRAAHWDGWIIGTINEKCEIIRSPQKLAEEIMYIDTYRTNTTSFDVAIDGVSRPGEKDTELLQQYEKAGATWWFEGIFGLRGSKEEMLDRISAGPPG